MDNLERFWKSNYLKPPEHFIPKSAEIAPVVRRFDINLLHYVFVWKEYREIELNNKTKQINNLQTKEENNA